MRARQREGIGHLIEVIGHLQVGIIDDIVDAIGPAIAQGSDTGCGQIVGMDVVGKYIISRSQRRQTFFQTLDRQALGGVNTRRAKDGDGNIVVSPPCAQTALGINTTSGPAAFRMQATGFIDRRASAIAVDTCRTHVNQAAW